MKRLRRFVPLAAVAVLAGCAPTLSDWDVNAACREHKGVSMIHGTGSPIGVVCGDGLYQENPYR